MKLLRYFLSINALVSGLSGLTMIVFHLKLAEIFGLQNSMAFWIIGIGLLFFATTVALEIKKQRALQILLIIIQDEVWVLGSLVLLLWQPWEFSPAGNFLVAGMAVLVQSFALGQSIGLVRMDRKPGSPQKVLRFSRTIQASRPKVWSILSDLDRYAEFAPNIDHSKVISGTEGSAKRVCGHGKESWQESCIAFKPGESYRFRVHTEAPDYPYPFRKLEGNWAVKPLSEAQSQIDMHFEFRFKAAWQELLLYPLMKGKFMGTAEELLDNWQKTMEEGEV